MDYATLFTHAEKIQTNGSIFIPPTYQGKTNFIIPDQIVNFCINKYDLLKKAMHILDPMCGIGTIPRIINQRGGYCLGIEIDANRLQHALDGINDNMFILGNCLETSIDNKYQCIFTSLPFDWFKQNDQPVADYAIQFNRLLTEDGFILLDSIPYVNRDGQEWPVASNQCKYLEANGFKLIEITRFINDNHVDDTNESVIMKFLKN